MKEKWWHSSVVYQVYPKSFQDSNGDGIGDIEGIITRVPYLKQLGIDVIWLNPVFKSPDVDNGYDISDYYEVNPQYGSLTDVERLFDVCRSHGIKVIMDLVVNHVSDQHAWFQDALKGEESPYFDYFIWSKEDTGLKSVFGGSAWEYVSSLDLYYLHNFAVEQPDLNWENESMRQAIYDMMNFWINKGIAGFRMDVIDLIGKQPFEGIMENGPKLHDYLQEMSAATFKDKDLLTVGETWGATLDNALLYSDPERHELSMIFQFEQIGLDEIPGKSKWDLRTLDFMQLKSVFSKWQYALNDNGWNSLFWNNHDLPRIVSRWGNDAEYREKSAKMLATLLHGMKGTPYIYQGEEISMTNAYFDNFDDYLDIEAQNLIKERLDQGYEQEAVLKSLQTKGRDNARTPMQWDDGLHAGFTEGTPWMKVNPNYKEINVASALEDSNSVFYTYQQLIEARKNHRVIRFGKFNEIDKENPHVFAYTRTDASEQVLVVCNFFNHKARVTTQLDDLSDYKVIVHNGDEVRIEGDQLFLEPYEAMMLIKYKK